MLSIQFILQVFKGLNAVRIIYFFLALSIIQLGDLIFTVFMTKIFGDYLILGLICSISIAGLFISVLRIKEISNRICIKCKNGEFPKDSFYELTGLFLAASMIFIPGFISSLAGSVMLFPIIAKQAGLFISYKTSTDWHTVYEYMKI